MKGIFLTVVFSIITGVTFAQLSGGVKGGLNISQIRSEASGQSESTDMSVGFQLGGYLNYPLSDKVIFQPELIFSRVGGKESEYDPTTQEDVTLNLILDYLSIPVMFKFKTGESFYFLAGPQAGLLVSAKAKVELFGQSFKVDVKDGFNTLDFGLTAGIGFSKNKFGVDARYNFGLANIAEDSGDGKAQNRVISLAASYKLFQK